MPVLVKRKKAIDVAPKIDTEIDTAPWDEDAIKITGPYTQMKYKEAKEAAERETILNDPNRCLTLKKDGASYQLTKNSDGTVHLYSGGISKKDGLPLDKIDNCPHLKKMAEAFLPLNSNIIGEICMTHDFVDGNDYPHSASKRVGSIMNALPEKAIARQNNTHPVEFYMFDLLVWEGKKYYDKEFAERHATLERIYNNILPDAEWLTISPVIVENKDKILADWFANGEEGAVCMNMYGANSQHEVRPLGMTAVRRDNGVKIKTLSTFDVVIKGIIMPNKEYNGKYANDYEYRDEEGNAVNRLWYLGYANAFAIGYNEDGDLNSIGTVASGLTDEIRKDAAENPDDYIGRVIEVKCMSADSIHETLRHPVFLRFRDDKNAVECTRDTIFE